MKYLSFYTECIDMGEIPVAGLCNEFRLDPLFNLMTPSANERDELEEEGYCRIFWASGLPEGASGEIYDFTPLRQTIVLFMAAMNNEL